MLSRLRPRRDEDDPFEAARAEARRAAEAGAGHATTPAADRPDDAAAAVPTVSPVDDTPSRRPPPALRDDSGAAVGVMPSDRKYGTLVIGGQGMGKSSVLQRMVLADTFDPNCAQIVIDLKSELIDGSGGGEGDVGLLSVIDPRCKKPVYHLDLGDPRFGMSPLRLFGDAPLAHEATRIAASVVDAIGDLFEGQVFQSSERFLYYAVIGAVCLAYWEDRTPRFEDVAELLKPNARDAHAAAARAVQDIPELFETYQFFSRDLPHNLAQAYATTAAKMDPPGNKINLLVARAPVARFFSHPIDVPLRTIIRERGILLIDCNPAAIDIANAQAISLMILHQLHREMQRAMSIPESQRARVATVIDEAHYVLHSENIIDQVATHRAAGADFTFGLQFFAQLGSGSQHREKIRTGIWNLCQNKMLFRTSDPKDAETVSRAAMAIYNNRIETDPVARGRMRVAPETLIQMQPFTCLALLIANGDRVDPFIGQTFRMPRDVPDAWRRRHLEVMGRRIGPIPKTLPYRPSFEVERLDALVLARLADPVVWENVGAIDNDHLVDARPPVTLQADEVTDALGPQPTPDPPAATATPEPAHEDEATQVDGGVQTRLEDFLDPDERAEHSDDDETFAPPAGINVEVISATDDQEISPVLQVAARGRARKDTAPLEMTVDELEAWAGSRSGGAARADGTAPDSLRRLALIEQIVGMDSKKLEETKVPPGTGLPEISEQKLTILAYLDRVGIALGATIHAGLFDDKSERTTSQHLADLRKLGMIASAPVRTESADAATRPSQVHMLTSRGFQALRDAKIVPERREFHRVNHRRPGPLVHDLHVQEYLGALMRRLDGAATNNWRTPRQAAGRMSPPTVGRGQQRRAATVNEILMPGSVSVLGVFDEAMAEIKPDLVVEFRVGDPAVTFDVMVEVDVSGKTPRQERKFAKFDAFLCSWWHTVDRYQALGSRPLILFTAKTRKQMLAFAAAADQEMVGRVGRVGWPAASWQYPGRSHVLFALEEDMHRGDLTCLKLPALPPRARGNDALHIERVQLIDPNLLPDA